MSHALNYMVFHISQFQINKFLLSYQVAVEKCSQMWLPDKCFDQQEKGGISFCGASLWLLYSLASAVRFVCLAELCLS